MFIINECHCPNHFVCMHFKMIHIVSGDIFSEFAGDIVVIKANLGFIIVNGLTIEFSCKQKHSPCLRRGGRSKLYSKILSGTNISALCLIIPLGF